jgi:cholesterol transport system auxiliary component
MTAKLILGLLAGGLALTGCVKLTGKAPPQLLNLTSSISLPANEVRAITAGESIQIMVPTTPQAYANNRVAVADGPVSLSYVKDAVWVEPPARLFQRLLAETVAAKTGKTVLDVRQVPVEPALQLGGQIKAFGIDARASDAVIIYDATFSRAKGKGLETRRFEAHVPVSQITAMASGNALNQAANKVAGDVAEWIRGK